ncbi:hypothetical protein SAMN05444274_102100 [Mariniphaga anaerophila]|uniref:Uncharacterized protein n=1 Tax=Mariniphaga anaerophila TaxID=1484053 RepID=A0A1M4VHE8_9BACT|nr:hypothetical protein SAMN05444274_102100 [Mariniphaga anaerophila]
MFVIRSDFECSGGLTAGAGKLASGEKMPAN